MMRIDNNSKGECILILEHGDLDKYKTIIENLVRIPNLMEIHFKNLTGKETMKVRSMLSSFMEISGFYDIDIEIRRK
jgi:hypothetical protein